MNVTKDKKTSTVETYEEIECFKNITNDDLMINISWTARLLKTLNLSFAIVSFVIRSFVIRHSFPF